MEAPTATTWSVLLRSAPAAARTGGAATRLPAVGGRTRAIAAALIFSITTCATSGICSLRSSLGFVTKSTAPSSRARNVVAHPASVRDDTITTGMGCARMSFSRKASPSMRGISTSRVSTSGLSRRILSRATYGSEATPTTSMDGSRASKVDRTCRMRAESSTISTRMRGATIVRCS